LTKDSLQIAMKDTLVPKVERRTTETTQDPFEDTRTATYQERLAQMDLQRIAKVNQPSWRGFCAKNCQNLSYPELKEWNLKERALNSM
jgi:hypothetical protein